MHAIEARAGALFADHGFPQLGAEPAPLDDFRTLVAGNTCLVAVDNGDRPLGFAAAGAVGDVFWLKELSVDSDAMRRGIGSALLEAVATHARAAGYRRLGLSTFRDVPFNAPFYARRGFAVVDPDLQPRPIRDRFLAEVPDGVDAADRVPMLRDV